MWRYDRGPGLTTRTGAVGTGDNMGGEMAELRGTHVPVLLERFLDLVAPALTAAAEAGRTPVHVDATLGLGGHAEAILTAHPTAVLIGLDRDTEALAHAKARLAPFGDRVRFVHTVYDGITAAVNGEGFSAIDSALFDLGVSSLQLDAADRGFAYAQDAPLDMRMDQTTGQTAEDIINTYPEPDLVRLLRVYGEEKFAPRVVSAISKERAKARITSSALLAELVRNAIPAATRRTGGHPAKRTFQALRIEVNQELKALEAALPAALDLLVPGGRLVVMSYHSLEDRITKQAIAPRTKSTALVDLPVELPGTGPTFRFVTRGGAELPDDAEVAANPRAASVRLRAAERLIDNADPGDRERPGRAYSSRREARGRPADATEGEAR